MADQISFKFSSQMQVYLPKVKIALDDLRQFKERTEMQMLNTGGGLVDEEKINSISFMCNNLKSEIDYMKRIWNTKKLQHIDNIDSKQ